MGYDLAVEYDTWWLMAIIARAHKDADPSRAAQTHVVLQKPRTRSSVSRTQKLEYGAGSRATRVLSYRDIFFACDFPLPT